MQIVSGSIMDDLYDFLKIKRTSALVLKLKEKTNCFDENISNTIKIMLEKADNELNSAKLQFERMDLSVKQTKVKIIQKHWFDLQEAIPIFEDQLTLCLKMNRYSPSEEKKE